MIIVLMGVCGCGKTVVGEKLAEALGGSFSEGDEFHSDANREKMRGGTPLTDEDRWPWLASIAEAIDGWRADGKSAVVACSALRRVYRDILIGDRDDVHLVHLKGDYDLIHGRLMSRSHEYMPVTLLDSQFATLEEPTAEENPINADIIDSPDVLVEKVAKEVYKRAGS